MGVLNQGTPLGRRTAREIDRLLEQEGFERMPGSQIILHGKHLGEPRSLGVRTFIAQIRPAGPWRYALLVEGCGGIIPMVRPEYWKKKTWARLREIREGRKE